MADLVNNLKEFSEDSMQRLLKDLNYMFTHLDERNVKRLYTEYCEIKSEDGETEIDGPLLIMKAEGSTVIRVKMGWDEASSEFLFNLYNSTGGIAISLDSTGNAVFSGTLNTSQDAYIGKRLILGWPSGTNLPTASLAEVGMYLIREGTTEYITGLYTTVYSFGTPNERWEADFESSNLMAITAKNTMNIYSYGGYEFGVSPINSSDYQDIYSFNNRALINSDYEIDTATTVKGTFIGHSFRDVFVGTTGDLHYNKVIANRDLEVDFADRLKYYYMHNVRVAPPCTTTPDAILGCHLVSSTERMASTLGIRIYALTTTVGYNQFDYNLANALDFANFNDGTAMSSDDKIVYVVYITSTSILSGNKVFFRLGQSSDVCWNMNTSDYNYTTGWNLVVLPFAYGSIEGAPVMSAVNWVRFGWYGGHSTTAYVIIDYIGVIRKNSTDATWFNPFVRDYNSTNYNEHESLYGAVMLENAGEPAIVQLPIDGVEYYDMWLRTGMQNFELQIDNFAMLGDYSPVLSAYIDSSNLVVARVTSGVLRISGLVDNSTFGRTINCDAFVARSNTRLKLKRQLATWTASFELTTEPGTFREVTMYNGPGPNWEDECAVYLGTEKYDQGSRITSIKIKPYTQ